MEKARKFNGYRLWIHRYIGNRTLIEFRKSPIVFALPSGKFVLFIYLIFFLSKKKKRGQFQSHNKKENSKSPYPRKEISLRFKTYCLWKPETSRILMNPVKKGRRWLLCGRRRLNWWQRKAFSGSLFLFHLLVLLLFVVFLLKYFKPFSI